MKKKRDSDTNGDALALAMLRKHMQSTPAATGLSRRPLSASGANSDSIRTNGQQVLYGGVTSPASEPGTASLNRRMISGRQMNNTLGNFFYFKN